ncbi:putative reverse transcriptase [Arabidopsis thaliana]|uniref:Putative reverse transcriptase n=1 Tax=Arabidopsis thaliana TaxID=3702 RepID=O81429_ARATH|nr:contains similarity to reverse transcriptases [Arabidopsis thaliana]CAB77880.1 putative reverse transcriptase [Arabidopsis thaliana]
MGTQTNKYIFFDRLLKVIKEQPADVRLEAWDSDKDAAIMQPTNMRFLDNDLRSLTLGDLSVHDYCQKLKTLSDLLANVDSPVSDRVVVTHMLNGLSEKFDNIINIIKHRQPFPSFSVARSMLIEEERRLSKQVKTGSSHSANSSSPNVLYVTSNGNQNSMSRDNNHNTYRDNNNTGYRDNNHNNYNGHNNNGRGRGRGRGGTGSNGRGRGRQNWQWNPRNWQTQQPWLSTPTPYPHWPQQNWMQRPPMAYLTATNPAAGLLGSSPQAAMVGSTNQLTQIPANLAAAFGTTTMPDPTDASWYMDTGATTHLTAQPGTLHSLFNSSSSPSVVVGNGSSVPTKAIGYSFLPSKIRPLHLHNVLVCPSIIKNLVSVRQFTKDNYVSVEFDPFGFSIKDFNTWTNLLRCNSDGPLYSITSPPLSSSSSSSPPQVMVATVPDSSLWHRRLGHLGNTTLQSLISSRLIKSLFAN